MKPVKDRKKPLISIGMIFRDNIRCLERCLKSLQPLRDALPCELVMADTGSVDGSREVAERYADILFDFPWIDDFAAARNAVLDRCSGSWFFSIDSDEWLDANIAPLLEFVHSPALYRKYKACGCTERNYSQYDLKGDVSSFMAMRMFQLSTGIRYEGAIHEHWNKPAGETYVITDLILHHDGYVNFSGEEGKDKRERNMAPLLKKLEAEPENLILRLQLIESSSWEDQARYIKEGMDLVRRKIPKWELAGPPIFAYGVRYAAVYDPSQLESWYAEAEALFPKSLYFRIDMTYNMLVKVMEKKEDYARGVELGERYLKGMKGYLSARDCTVELTYSTLKMAAPFRQRIVELFLADACFRVGKYERAKELIDGIDGAELEPNQVNSYISTLMNLHAQSPFDMGGTLARFMMRVDSREVEKERKACTEVVTVSGARAFPSDWRRIEDESGHARHAYTVFLPLKDRFGLGLGAAVLETEDPVRLGALLCQVEDWGAFPIPALAHALERGARFPQRALTVEDMDSLASRLARSDELSDQIALAPCPDKTDVQAVCWKRALAFGAMEGFDWEDGERGMPIVRAFVEIERFFLPLCYAPGALTEQAAFLLPMGHRFGWYLVRAFDALDAGNLAEYVRLLRLGLDANSGTKPVAEFLLEHTPQLQAPPTPQVPPELLALAEQVRSLMAQYDPDDPAVAAMRESPAYQRVAHLLEDGPIVTAQAVTEPEPAPAPAPVAPAPAPIPPSRRSSALLDRQFAALVEACASVGEDKLFYRLKKGFLKLPKQIQQQQTNYLNTYPLWGSFRPEMGDFGVLAEKAKSLTAHAGDYAWLYDRLEDFRSRKLLYAILSNWARFDFETLGDCRDSCFDDYFDLDVFPCGPGEVVADLGAYIGDTVVSFVNTYGRDAYRRYYCYEISPDTMETLKQNTADLPNIIYRQKGAGERAGTMSVQLGGDASANALTEGGDVQVEVAALDEDITEPITVLKMDIEGAEQAAIRGAAGHIRNDRPKMALSVYHNNEDLWKIPRMIDELCPGCRFYLRYHGGNLWPTEISFLAVPDR